MLRGAGDQLTVTSLDFSPNGRIVVSASLDGTVRIWSLRDGSSKQALVTTGYTDLRVTFSPIGGYVAAGTGDGVLCILDTRSRELVKRWEGHQNDVSSLAYMPDGNGLLSSSFDGTVKHWDVSSLRAAQKRRTAKNSVALICQFGGHPVR
jgi:WD40 repeat protein